MKTPSHHEGRAVADRLIDEVKGNSPAAVNFGFALRLPGQEVATALARADQVMYAAKGRSLRSTRR